MARLDTITDADLLDYVEGRLPPHERAIIASRLEHDTALAAKCTRVREQILNVRMLRSILPVEAVPEEWLDLLARGRPH
jgi:anti-sigma factor RsiW